MKKKIQLEKDIEGYSDRIDGTDQNGTVETEDEE